MGDESVHQVREGEWASAIALAHGITKWRSRVWDLGENARLKQRRDPYVLAPEDELSLPTDREKLVEAETEKRHRFRVRAEPDVIRVRLLKESLEPITKDSKASTQCSYTFSGSRGSDVSGTQAIEADGVVTLTVPRQATCVILKFEEDRGDGRVMKHKLLCRLGHLRPMDADDPVKLSLLGVQQRLDAMGFSPGPRDGLDGPRTRAAICSFQAATKQSEKRDRLCASELDMADARPGQKLWDSLRKAYGA